MSKVSQFKLGDLFTVVSGKTQKPYGLTKGNTPFVSASDANNGVSARIDDAPTFEANLITISRNGSVCEAFFQPFPFCASLDDIRVLIPKSFKLDLLSGLYICAMIKREKFRYNYGRKFGTTRIRETKILLPVLNNKEIDWKSIQDMAQKHIQKTSDRVKEVLENKFDKNPVLMNTNLPLGIDKWLPFALEDLFDIKKGKRLIKEDMTAGNTPFIAAIDSNNGWRNFIDQLPIHTGNTITVNYNGSVAKAFYQPLPFQASDDVNVLYPKFAMTVYTAIFIATIIEREKYRFNYGRKWHKERMEKSAISLPAKNGKPDFSFMENYIKSLPYSRNLSVDQSAIIERPQAIQKPQVEKGLSDEELVKKYESGRIDLGKTLKPILKK